MMICIIMYKYAFVNTFCNIFANLCILLPLYMYAQGDTSVMFCGENGRIHLENIFNPISLMVYNKQGDLVETILRPEQITGYEYEVRSCMKAIEAGESQCPEMPHKDTLFMLDLMDGLRAQWGMKYPVAKEAFM